MSMKHKFKVGDHASKDEQQYLIKSDKTEHMAMHKGAALKKLSLKKPVSRR